jgi:SAM-dependent methyltransferase
MLSAVYRAGARLADRLGGSHPHSTILHPQWLSIRAQRQALIAASSQASGLLLDVGCGRRPFEPWLRPRVTRYIGLDYPAMAADPSLRADVFGSALELPLGGGCVDTVLLTEVLEHTPEPDRLLAEVARVLRPNGTLILSTPMMYNVHGEPHDFFRFTPYGLRVLLERHGFSVATVRPLGYVGSMLGVMWNNAVTRLLWRHRWLRALRATLLLPAFALHAVLVNALGWAVDRVMPDPYFSFGHLVVARRIPLAGMQEPPAGAAGTLAALSLSAPRR